MVIHVVNPGDTLFSIAQNYNVSYESIILNNGLEENQPLVVGQALLILIPRQTHTVRQGETLQQIADAYNTTVSVILQNNLNLNGQDRIEEGETIVIDYYSSPLGNTYLNGYTYTFISNDTLLKTLPFLSYITVFTYGISESGTLITPDDENIIYESSNYGTLPIMLISTLSSEGTFSNELAHLVLNSPEIQSVLIEEIINTLDEKGYAGLDVDFEYILPEDKELYTQFITSLASALHPKGYFISVSLAPKTSADQPGLLYESHDYRALGAAADYVLLMTYEWGYKFGPPMAVSPLNKVRQVLEYALTEIPAEKIFLGLPNYAYDWELPFIRNVSQAETISNLQAVKTASEYNAEIEFDNTAKTPYFYYRDQNQNPHVVWFEDPRSYKAKASLIKEYGIRGMSIWNIMRFFPQGLLTISTMYNINKF